MSTYNNNVMVVEVANKTSCREAALRAQVVWGRAILRTINDHKFIVIWKTCNAIYIAIHVESVFHSISAPNS